MDIEQLRKELEADEGCKYEIYLDHLGYKTFGIGHLCKATDPENDMDVGTEEQLNLPTSPSELRTPLE